MIGHRHRRRREQERAVLAQKKADDELKDGMPEPQQADDAQVRAHVETLKLEVANKERGAQASSGLLPLTVVARIGCNTVKACGPFE